MRQTHEQMYENCLRRSETVYEDERARRYRLNILLLKVDQDDLHVQLSQDDYRIVKLEKSIKETQNQLDIAEGEAERLRGETRMRTREAENLRVIDKRLGVISHAKSD